jgi:hypothetical protein
MFLYMGGCVHRPRHSLAQGYMALTSAKMAIGSTKVGKYSFPFKMTRDTFLLPSTGGDGSVGATAMAVAAASAVPTEASGAPSFTLSHAGAAATSPLKWFGMVVPVSLRTAQHKFLQGTVRSLHVLTSRRCSRAACVRGRWRFRGVASECSHVQSSPCAVPGCSPR